MRHSVGSNSNRERQRSCADERQRRLAERDHCTNTNTNINNTIRETESKPFEEGEERLTVTELLGIGIETRSAELLWPAISAGSTGRVTLATQVPEGGEAANGGAQKQLLDVDAPAKQHAQTQSNNKRARKAQGSTRTRGRSGVRRARDRAGALRRTVKPRGALHALPVRRPAVELASGTRCVCVGVCHCVHECASVVCEWLVTGAG